jgi:hypothetical protein
MGDQSNAVAFQGSGQTQEPLSQEGANAAQPQYITRDEAARMAKEAAEEAFRRAQGLMDRGNQKVRERIAQLENSWAIQAQAGAPVSEDVKEKSRTLAMQTALMEPDSSQPASRSQPGQPAQAAQQGADEPPDPITAEGWRLMDEAGITFEDNDPEMGTIIHSTPLAYLNSIQAAIDSKRRRLQGQQQTQVQTTRTPTSAGTMGAPAMGVDAITARLNDLMSRPSNHTVNAEIRRLTEELDKHIPRG